MCGFLYSFFAGTRSRKTNAQQELLDSTGLRLRSGSLGRLTPGRGSSGDSASLRRVNSLIFKIRKAKRAVNLHNTAPLDRWGAVFMDPIVKVQLDYQPFIKNAGLPQRLTNELAELFRLHLSKPHGKNTAASNVTSIQTQQYRVQVLTAGFRDLRKGGFAIESPWNLADKHIRYLVNLWVNEKKHSPGTVENRLTYWRTLAAWMKKHQLVGTMDDYIDRPNGYRRFYGAQEDK